MISPTLSLDRLFLVLCIFLGCSGMVPIVSAANETTQGFMSFQSGCNCSLTLTCTCCQGAILKSMDISKTLCMAFKINIFKASVDVTVTLDGVEVSKFTLDSKTTPSFCLPVISQLTPMAVCLKMSTKLSGLTNLNMCPSFYSSFAENQLLAFDFPCLKLGMDGISIA